MKNPLRNKEREETQDALKHFHECEYEGGGALSTPESLAGAIGCTRNHAVEIIRRLKNALLCDYVGNGVKLSKKGRDYARQVIRAHRLYETYLATKTATPPSDWHKKADRIEHSLGGDLADRLSDKLGHPRFDPHGDPIPTRFGSLPALSGQDLLSINPPACLRVLHVGDEPETLARQLNVVGVAPGSYLYYTARDESKLLLTLEGREIALGHGEATLIRVELLPNDAWQSHADVFPLARLREGESAIVSSLSPACRGAERSRLLDLGFVRGSLVEADMASPFGSPMAYRVRGALVALRASQASLVLVRPATQPSAL